MTDGLFPAEPYRADGALTYGEAERLSVDRRRTLRQRRMVDDGLHPLAALSPLVRRHPETLGDVYTASDERGRPYTCGSCRFRVVMGGEHAGRFPKCTWRNEANAPNYYMFVTSSPASDCRAWWPACTRYEAGDPAMSPDAARCLPGGAA